MKPLGHRCERIAAHGRRCGTFAYARVRIFDPETGIPWEGWCCGCHQSSARKRRCRVTMIEKWKGEVRV